jgi:hypothetical protein
MAWNNPKSAMEIRYPIKKKGSTNANASVPKNTAMKMLNIPFWAYWVQMATTFFESSTDGPGRSLEL